MPYDLVADPKCSEVVASANFHFFVCERTSNAEVFRHSYEKVVCASSCRISKRTALRSRIITSF
jgi:hypothetical protein